MISKVLETVSRAMTTICQTGKLPGRIQNFSFKKIANSFQLDFRIVARPRYQSYPIEGNYSIVITKEVAKKPSKLLRSYGWRAVAWSLTMKFIKDGAVSIVKVGQGMAKENLCDHRIKTSQILAFWKRLKRFSVKKILSRHS